MFTQTERCSWYCLVGNLKRWKDDTPVLRNTVQIGDKTITLEARRGPVHGTSYRIDFSWDGSISWAELLEAVGEIPIPPYAPACISLCQRRLENNLPLCLGQRVPFPQLR